MLEIKYVEGCIPGIQPWMAFITVLIFQGLRIILPIILLIKAVINLGKASNMEEINKGKTNFIRALVKATIIFLIFTFIQFGISLLAEASSDDIWTCIRKMIYF